MAENEKQTNKERLKDITDSIERGIEELFQSDKYAEYAIKEDKEFHAYYQRLTRYDFCKFNKIYDSDLLQDFEQALFPF